MSGIIDNKGLASSVNMTEEESNGLKDTRLFKDRVKKSPEGTMPFDDEWTSNAFMVGKKDLEKIDQDNRFFSTADLKFTDTTIGGNLGINSRPQFTRYCDIRRTGQKSGNDGDVTVDSTGHHGMGRYYSESIDDNSQNLYLTFGVPKFNSLLTFFSRSVDPQAAIVARTGSRSKAYDAAKAAASTGLFLVFPLLSTVVWAAKAATYTIAGDAPLNYYYLKPAMHMYWSTVNTILSSMAAELGILLPDLMSSSKDKVGGKAGYLKDDLKEMRKLMPDIFTESNYIDVMAIANRAQVMANNRAKANSSNENASATTAASVLGGIGSYVPDTKSFTNWVKSLLSNNTTKNFETEPGDPKQKSAEGSDSGKAPTPEEIKDAMNKLKPDKDGVFKKTAVEKSEGLLGDMSKYFESALTDGAAYAVIKVDYVGSVTESFSNQIGDIPTTGKIKSMAQAGRSTMFTFAGGNIAGDLTRNVSEAVNNIVKGTLDAVTAGASNVISAMFGGAYVDIPKMWLDSTASMPKLNFTVKLISPYGNTISRLQNIYIPLSMLLAGTLPLATGNASYTSPMLCKMFLKGIQNVEMGMITDLSITRGTSNLAFNKYKDALAMDISFSITDFSSIMAAPVDPDLFGGNFGSIADGSVFGRYIATISSRDLLTSKYALNKAKINLSKSVYAIDKSISRAFIGARVGDIANSFIGGLFASKSLALSDTNG